MDFFNDENEKILCCMLMQDESLVERVASSLHDEDFYVSINQFLFSTILNLYGKGVKPDLLTINSEFKKAGRDKDIVVVAEISGMTFTTANADFFIQSIKNMSLKRKTARIIENAKARLERKDEDATSISGELEQEISNANLRICGNEYKHASKYVLSAITDIEQFIRTEGRVFGVDAPFKSLAEITDFRNGEYIIIAARASIGKTACALNMIEEIAIRRKINTGIFSIEMTAKQLNLRLISSLTGLSSWGINKGMYRSIREMDRMMCASKEIYESGLFIDDTSNIKLSELKTKLRRMVKIDGCKIIFIDYIGLINSEQPRLPRHEQIAEISRSIKTMAKELDVPIVVLSQLTRDFEGKKPTLNSLAETRSLEQDSDVIIFINRQRKEDMSEDEQKKYGEKIPAELIVAKNRNGPTGVCNMFYIPRITKFVDSVDNSNVN